MKQILTLMFMLAVVAPAGVLAQETYPEPFQKGNKWGYKDSDDNEVIEPKYDDAKAFSEGLARVKSGGKWGYIDPKGKVVIAIKFDDVADFSDGVAGAFTGGSGGYIDKTGKQVISLPLSDAYWYNFSEGMAPVRLKKNDQYGFIDKSGKVAITPRFDEAFRFSQGRAAVRVKKDWGYIDKTGKWAVPARYDKAYNFESVGLAPVQLKGKWGFVDKNGREVVRPKYDATYTFQSVGLATVVVGGKHGFIDKSGREIVAPKYDQVYAFSEGFATVVLGGKYGFIDASGREITPLKYDNTYAFSEGLATVMVGDKKGKIDTTGREIIPPEYSNTWAFAEGFAVVEIDGKHGFFDTSGKQVVPPKYDDAFAFSEGMAIVKTGDKYGFIDTTGREVIPTKYDDVFAFTDGMATVMLKGRRGRIDKTGREVIPPKYDKVNDFSNGVAIVIAGSRMGLIDETGRELVAPVYDEIGDFTGGFARVKASGKMGIIDTTGNEVVPLKYDAIYASTDGLVSVKSGSKFGFVDRTGREVIPVMFPSAKEAEAYRKNFQSVEQFILGKAKRDLERWSTKDEFESSAEFEARVNPGTYEQKIKELIERYSREYEATPYFRYEVAAAENKGYDADRQTMLLGLPSFGDLVVKLPGAEEARALKDNWEKVVFSAPEFLPVKNDDGTERLVLSRLTMTNSADSLSFSWDIHDNHAFRQTPVKITDLGSFSDFFRPVTITVTDDPATPQPLRTNTPATPSDVDVNIPKTAMVNDKTFVVIFANENYTFEVNVPFAKNDGRIFREYCINTLGIPEANITYAEDATGGVMTEHIGWLTSALAAHDGEAKAIVFYSGHGINDGVAEGNSYLLPTDVRGSNIRGAFPLDRMFTRLGEVPAKSITYFVDACHSGAMRTGAMMAETRGVAIAVRKGEPKGNSVLFSACQGDQVAHAYDEKQHGMFTYFLLKSLRDSKGEITYEQLSSEIMDGVRRASLVTRKTQIPLVEGSATTGLGWKAWTFAN